MKRLSVLLLSCLAIVSNPAAGAAGSFPDHRITLIVPFPPAVPTTSWLASSSITWEENSASPW